MPLSAPALATLSIVVFTAQWNNLVWPLVVLNSKKLYTLPLGLALLRSEFQVNYGITSAAAFLSVVPLVIVFIFLQRYFLEGLTVGGSQRVIDEKRFNTYFGTADTPNRKG